MTGKDIFKIWAPAGIRWSGWVRPVPFVLMDASLKTKPACNLSVSDINYTNELLTDTAIIIDLPGYDSIKDGLALAKMGYRPIPLFNGTKGQEGAMSLVDSRIIEEALIWGAAELKEIPLPPNAPPVFLLDSNRIHRYKMSRSVFDNSWDIYDQDMPSANYFLSCGISKIIVRGEKIHRDLIKILPKFTQKKIKVFFTNGYEAPKEVKINKTLAKLRRYEN